MSGLHVFVTTMGCLAGMWGVSQMVKQVDKFFGIREDSQNLKQAKANLDMYNEATMFLSTKPHEDWGSSDVPIFRVAYYGAKDVVTSCTSPTSLHCEQTYKHWKQYLKSVGLSDYQHKS